MNSPRRYRRREPKAQPPDSAMREAAKELAAALSAWPRTPPEETLQRLLTEQEERENP